ncbi:MAG: hypothetical protein WKF75_02550 [Singulisphaera sp.]
MVDQLHRLGEVLAGYNPTVGNLELSRHIERIETFPDGRVVLRGTLMGLFEGAAGLLGRGETVEAGDGGPMPANGFAPVVPRRRGRLRVPDLSAGGQAEAGARDTALDPDRFAGMPERLFWTESFVIAPKVSWAEGHAEEVYQAKLATGLSFSKLSERFGKTRPTVQHAWEIAAARRQSESTGEVPSSRGSGDRC